MDETFVSYRVARLLKEIGFSGECFKAYTPSGDIVDNLIAPTSKWDGYIEAPTHNLALRWVREALNILIEIKPVINNYPYYTIRLLDLTHDIKRTSLPYTCDTWEVAIEVGITEAITLRHLIP